MRPRPHTIGDVSEAHRIYTGKGHKAKCPGCGNVGRFLIDADSRTVQRLGKGHLTTTGLAADADPPQLPMQYRCPSCGREYPKIPG